MLAQQFLIVETAVLATTVGLMNAFPQWSPHCNRHPQRPNCQITFHAVSHRPANHPSGIQIVDERQKKPTLMGLDIADVACPFTVWLVGCEVPVQQVRCNVEAMIAFPGCFELLVSFNRIGIFAHQPANATVANVEPQLFHLLGHAPTAIATQRQAEVFMDVSQHDHALALAQTKGPTAKGQVPSRALVHDLAQMIDGQPVGVLCDKGEPHLPCS